MDVPPELAALCQWCLWRYDDGVKVPYQVSGQKARSNDATTWNTLTECQNMLSWYQGLGFLFSPDDPFCGIDLDDVLRADGSIAPWAAEVLRRFPTYAEISPSGQGIKLWLRGEIPGGKGKPKTKVSGDEGIECYDRGRFFTFTGQRLDTHPLELVDCQAALLELLPRYWPPKQSPPPPPPRPAVQRVDTGGPDVLERARLYVDKIPPVTSGQNRGTVTLQVAAILVRGFCLTRDQAFGLLKRWNMGCHPNDWPEEKLDRELWRKIRDTEKHEGERGWLLNGKRYDGPDADLRALLLSLEALTDDPETDDDVLPTDSVDAIPDHLLHPEGLLGDVIQHTLETSLYPQPEIALAGAISLLSVITGRRVCDALNTRTNVYVLSVNPARSGKERPREVNKEILYLANGQELLGPERIGSHAGLVSFVDKRGAILFQIDEMGRLLATCKDARRSPHLYNIASVLLQLYSSATSVWVADAYADTKKTKTIDQPHCVVFGTTTGETLWPNLSKDNISDGLMGRLLIFEGRGYVPFNEQCRVRKVPESILRDVRYWLELAPGEYQKQEGNLERWHPSPYVIHYSEGARELYVDHIRDINLRREGENAFRAAVWSGTGEKTAKLALIHACSRERGRPAEVTEDDVIWGKQLANYLTRLMLVKCSDELSENEVEARYKLVLKRVGSEKVSRNMLSRRIRTIKGRDLRDIINDLVESGQLTVETEETKGRSRLLYWRPDRYKPRGTNARYVR